MTGSMLQVKSTSKENLFIRMYKCSRGSNNLHQVDSLEGDVLAVPQLLPPLGQAGLQQSAKQYLGFGI